jgi:uncharacterized membrane protein
MLTQLGKFALMFTIAFGILNTIVQTALMSVALPQLPYFTLVFTPSTFTSIIAATAITQMPFAFILYAVGLLIFNALLNFVLAIPIAFYEITAWTGNPALIVGGILIGFFLQAMAWLYLLEVLAQFFFPL